MEEDKSKQATLDIPAFIGRISWVCLSFFSPDSEDKHCQDNFSTFSISVLWVSGSDWQVQDHRRLQSHDWHTVIISSPLAFVLRLLWGSVLNVALLGLGFSHLLSNKPTRQKNQTAEEREGTARKALMDLLVPDTPQQAGSDNPCGHSWNGGDRQIPGDYWTINLSNQWEPN